MGRNPTPGRRKAVVVLDPAQAALLDALALIHYRVPRTRLVKEALDEWLPGALEEMRRLHPEEVREVDRLSRLTIRRDACGRARVGLAPAPAGVIDLVQRRLARQQQRRRSRF